MLAPLIFLQESVNPQLRLTGCRLCLLSEEAAL